ncbi:MFS transporter [Thioclava kandeliae]|uniref:MFS transporter n=1 Tax=Thioclava kandeliae TaxID=3070818 RepID=A0ABV1SED0_9RHOB
MSASSTHDTGADRSGFGMFVITALTFFFAMSGTTLPTPLYTIYTQELDLSQVMITVIFAVYAAGVIAALLLTGRWSDQIGRKPVLYAGIACSVLADIVFCLAGNLWLILLGRVISGLSAGLFASTATAAVMDLVPKGREKMGVLTATAVNMGGLGLGPIMAGAVAETLPHPLVTPYILHLVLIALATLLYLRVPEKVQKVRSPDLAPQKLALPEEVRAAFAPAAIAAIAGFMVCGFYSAVIPGFLSKEMGHDSHFLIGFVAGFLFLASTLGQMIVDRLPEKIRAPLGCFVLGLGAALIAWAFDLRSLTFLLVSTLIAGIGHGLAFRSGMGAIGAAAPEDQRAGVISLYFVVSYVSISVPVVLFGLLTLVTPLAPLSIGFAILSAVLCGVALLLLLKRR